MIISINQQLTDPKIASIPITSEAFLFGCAVFETMRTYSGRIFRLDDHLERLYESAEHLGFEPKYSLSQTREEVLKSMEGVGWKESRLRVIFSPDDLIVMIEELEEKTEAFYKEGTKAVRFNGQRTLPLAKKLGDVFCYAANQHAKKLGVYESILIDSHGYVRECSYANLFWVKKGQLFTNDQNVLKGITRQTVIELSEGCQFEEVLYQDLLKMDELFITQTTSGILPLVEVEGKKIGEGSPGGLTIELMRRFEERVWGIRG